MKFVGLDLGGVNSLACVREDAGAESFQGSTHPERPSCVLLPLVRKEKLIAGDEAQRNERGSGMPWPPLAMAAPDGWSRATPPSHGGRVLLATIWQRLNAGGQWSDASWPPPPDGLPAPNKETPAECVAAEVLSVLKRTYCDATTAEVVLAIPNQLPEESQELLLRRLRGSRLVWRSVAAAMSWADVNASRITVGKRLAVLDAGLHGAEVSVFEFRQQEMDGRTFHVPVRRLNPEHIFKTDVLLADSPAPFSRLRPELARLEKHLNEISKSVGGQAELLICGPLADPFLALLQRRFPQFLWPIPELNAVARGSCLFAWRLARGWPTYLDVLPSLELFTLTEEREPHWLPLIPADREVSGGQPFRQTIKRRIFIKKGTTHLPSWLQRSGEMDFRKLTTSLPVDAPHDALADINVVARSAGGFARVCINPSQGQSDVFGAGQSVLLNWQSMERVARGPKEQWPKGLVKFAWPNCGELLANRDFFRDFLLFGERLEKTSQSRETPQWGHLLPMLKEQIRRTINPYQLGASVEGGAAAPVDLLLCFGSNFPCRFWSNQSAITEQEIRHVERMGGHLWERLRDVEAHLPRNIEHRKALIYVLGRLGGHAPKPFQDWLAAQIVPTAKEPILFAAGRVLTTAEHGRKVFNCLKTKGDFGQELKLPWLRMLVYLLYQRETFLANVSRDDTLTTTRLALNVFATQVKAGKKLTLFKNSLRTLALLLRFRRNRDCFDFLTARAHSSEERDLATDLNRTLEQALQLRLNDANRDLVSRTQKWLLADADSGEFPPVVTSEDDSVDDVSDDETGPPEQ